MDMNNKETQESNTVKNESKTVIKKAVSIIGLLFISTIIIYFLFSLYFINHLYFNTTINNDNFQLLSADKSDPFCRCSNNSHCVSFQSFVCLPDSSFSYRLKLKLQ